MTKNALKLTVIGGGSVYTPELIEGLIQHRTSIPLHTLTLMDISSERLETLHGLTQRMLAHRGYDLNLEKTTDRYAALDGADFVITQIRVGGMNARILDETLPLRYGVVGQETVGPGGFANALRTIPVMLSIASDMEQLCPDAWLINFANPAGVITEAILNHTRTKTIGLCNIPANMRSNIANLMHVPVEQIELDYVGINHLSWIRGVRIDGEACMDAVLQAWIEIAYKEDDPLFSPDLLTTLRMIPCYYLTYYYNRPRMLAEQRQATQLRAERVMEIERELMQLYANPKTVEKPVLLSERGGSHYSTAALRLIDAIVNDSGNTQVVNVMNRGTFTNLPEHVVIETPCRVDASGAHPLPADPIPLQVVGLLEAVKAAEQLTVQAAVHGDMQLALRALVSHPLVPSFAAAQSLLADIVSENIDYLPQFESLFTG